MEERKYLYKLKSLYNKDGNIWNKYWRHFFQTLENALWRIKWEGSIHTYDKVDYLYYNNNILNFFLKNKILKKTDDLEKISSHIDIKKSRKPIQYWWREYIIEFEIIDREKVSEILDFFPHFSDMSYVEYKIEKQYMIWPNDDRICVQKIPKGILILKKWNDWFMEPYIKTAPKILKLFDILTNTKKGYVTMTELRKNISTFKSKSDVLKTISDLRKFMWDDWKNKYEDYKYLMTWNAVKETTYFLHSLRETRFSE